MIRIERYKWMLGMFFLAVEKASVSKVLVEQLVECSPQQTPLHLLRDLVIQDGFQPKFVQR